MTKQIRTNVLMTAGLIAAATMLTACGADPDVPPAQSQTGVSQQVNTPATVTGCLLAGDAADTFVLTTSQTEDGSSPATYHLTDRPEMNLRQHVGTRVQATGVIDSQSQIATRESAQPADSSSGTAGTGTPTVQTGTQLAIKRFDVTSIKPVGGECEM